jgi:hypothetical protein
MKNYASEPINIVIEPCLHHAVNTNVKFNLYDINGLTVESIRNLNYPKSYSLPAISSNPNSNSYSLLFLIGELHGAEFVNGSINILGRTYVMSDFVLWQVLKTSHYPYQAS